MPNNKPQALFARDLKYLTEPSQHTHQRALSRSRYAVFCCTIAVLAAGMWTIQSTIASNDVQLPAHNYRSVAQPTPGFEPFVNDDRDTHAIGSHPPSAARTVEQETTDCSWSQHQVKRGNTLSAIFKHAGIPVRSALRLARDKQTAVLRSLVPGRVIRLCKDQSGSLAVVVYDLGDLERLVVRLDGEQLNVSREETEVTVRHRFASGNIRSSLFDAGARAGLDDKMILQLLSLFGWDIDFALDLRRGDQFSVIYEQLYDGDRRVGTGDIVAAQFINRGDVFRAIRHIDEHGNLEYYTPEGMSLRGTFLRTPVKFSRITSRFSRKRFHPLLKKWRAHRGVDYSAAKGTPVVATADGRVTFLGRKGGYGKAVVIQHGGTYSTLYGHLSRFKRGVSRGKKVEQGQVIGYVGRTGLATAPHLHYEFRVNGRHRDPLSFEMPREGRIPDKYRGEFLIAAQEWLDQLATYAQTQVATK